MLALLHISMMVYLWDEDPYTVDIAVISMKQAGFEEEATVSEIVARYEELGYRPLSRQEVASLRYYFTDQPNVSTGHWMSAFYTLPCQHSDPYRPAVHPWTYYGLVANLNAHVLAARYIYIIGMSTASFLLAHSLLSTKVSLSTKVRAKIWIPLSFVPELAVRRRLKKTSNPIYLNGQALCLPVFSCGGVVVRCYLLGFRWPDTASKRSANSSSCCCCSVPSFSFSLFSLLLFPCPPCC